MADNKAMIAEILSLSSQLEKLVETGKLVLEFPISTDDNSELSAFTENPNSVDYIVRSEGC
jgi:hypothetical protein